MRLARGEYRCAAARTRMNQILRNNFRWLGLPMIVILITAALASSSEWRCLDGKLCPSGGPGVHQQMAAPAHSVASHACCRPRISIGAVHLATLSSGMQCVLSHADQPAASLSRYQLSTHVTVISTLLPCTPVVAVIAPSNDWACLTADLPPPPNLSTSPGRSPPQNNS